MRTSKTTSTIAAITFGITGALAFSQQQVEANTVATVTVPGYARLYQSDGKLITDRALAANTPWAVGKIITINDTTYYQVATNEYLSSKDSTLNHTDTPASKVRIILGNANIYNDQTDSIETGHILPQGSEWRISRIITNKYSQTFVQVGTHEFAFNSMMLFTMKPNTTYIPDFGTSIKSNGTDTNLGPWSPINHSNNINNSNDPDVSSTQQAILTSINNERATKGIAPIQMSNVMNQAALIRAKEIVQSFSHTRPNGTSCFTVFPSYSTAEENIFFSPNIVFEGNATYLASMIMDDFRAEDYAPSHYTNLMSPNVNTIGIGVYSVNGTTYVTQEFIG